MKTLDRIRKKMNEGCADYSLIEDGDRILVALSGGKDSMLLARLLAERSRVFVPRFTVEAAHVVMDNIPYETDLAYLERYCQDCGLPLHVLHSRFDESTDKRKTKCFLCAWYRRKALFSFATEQGFTKVALGHHQDDILTTWLMNMTFTGATDTMSPRVEMRHYPIAIIRPLCLVPEALIGEVAAAEGLQRQKRPCPYETASRRTDIARIFHQLETLNPEARHCLWKAMTGK